MSGFLGRKGGQGATPQRLAAINVQTSTYGACIPIAFGQGRITGNVIYYTDFRSIPQSTSTGAKGGGSTVTGYTYQAALIVSLAEGPIGNIQQAWANNAVLASAFTGGWTLFEGSFGQGPWSYVTTNHPTEARGYSGVAYVANPLYTLASDASFPNHAWEYQGAHQIGGSPFIYDCDPADCIQDFLTSPYFGALGSSSFFVKINNLSTTASSADAWWWASGLFVSPIWATQQEARQHLQELMDCLNAEFVYQEMVLLAKTYADTALTGNGVTFTPALTPAYDLTDHDFLPSGTSTLDGSSKPEDPVKVSRKPNANAPNCVQVEYLDRAHAYNVAVADARDQTDVQQFGLRIDTVVQAHFIHVAAVAQMVAQLLLQRRLFVRNTYTFRLGLRYALLMPMDIVTLTDAVLGLNALPVRIVSIEEDEQARLTVTAEDWPSAVATAPVFGVQTGGGYAPNAGSDPGNANAPVMFEAPTALTGGVRQLWLVTSGSSTNWGGANVWVSTDNTTYRLIGTVGMGRHGTLTATYPSATRGVDSADTLAVDLTVSGGTLTSGSASDMTNFSTLCFVDGEVTSYQTATLTASFKYNLKPNYRGAYLSTISSHASGSKFARLDGAVFKYNIPDALSGQTLYVKLQSVNSQGQGAQDLSGLTAYTIALAAQTFGTNPVSGAYTVKASDKVLLVDASGGPVDVTLLAPADVYRDYQLVVKKVDHSTNPVNLRCPSGVLLDGTNGAELAGIGNAVVLDFDGSNYYITADTNGRYAGFGEGFGDNFGGG